MSHETRAPRRTVYEGVSLRCHVCSERIEDPGTSVYAGDCPVVIRVTVGVAPLHPTTGDAGTDVTEFAMPAIVREILAHPTQFMLFCPECFSERLGLPMLNADGSTAKRRG